MFEIWVNQETPSIHLVKRPESDFPNQRKLQDWQLLGMADVDPAIAALVARDGYAEASAVRPFNAGETFTANPLDAGPGPLPPL